MANVFVSEGSSTVGSPSAGDSLFVLSGAAPITTNVDQSAIDLVKVEVSAAYGGQFGTEGNPFYAEVTSSIWYGALAGDMYYRGKDTTDATPQIYVAGNGHFHFVTDGTATRFDVASGFATIAGPCIVVTLTIAGGETRLLDDTSTDPTLVQLLPNGSGRGGKLYSERGGTAFTNKAGDLTIKAGTNTIGTLNCDGPASIAKTVLQECGTITTLKALGHIPDTRALTRPLTITNTEINMSLPGAQAFLDHPLITFSNAATRAVTDGRFLGV